MSSSAHLLRAISLAFACLLADSATTQDIDFNRDVRPILSDKCFQCHGPDAEVRKADLRLDVRADVFRKRGDRPPAVVAGDVKASELVRRIHHEDPKERMPPRSADKQLTDKEKSILTAWVEQGAKWSEHWAFVTPRTPTMPVLRDKAWPQNDIDRLVLARLEKEGLRPASAADRHTLIRRLSFDLIGLPPKPAEVAAFVIDESPDAYEKLVNRLLSSPHYGEHMARFWLDAARYGDTHGLHLDNYREMWKYRDWVVQAFGNNMPFDRFAVEQLAGDLLPGATLAQQIASGFNRCHVTTNEGGSIKEEVYVRNVVDRVATTGTVFLGISLGCAVCHDHKFDPVTQKEFYQLFAFFNNLDANPMDGNAKKHAPTVRVPSAEQTAQLTQLKADRGAVEAEIKEKLALVNYTDPALDKQAENGGRRTIVWIDDALPDGAAGQGEGLVWVDSPPELVHSGRRAMKCEGEGQRQHSFAKAKGKLRVGAGDLLFAWVHIDPADKPQAIMLQWNIDGAKNWNQRAYWGADVIPFGKGKNQGHRRMGRLPKAGRWVRLEVPTAAVGLRPGMAIHGIAVTQSGGTVHWDTIGIETATSQEPEDFVWIDDATPKGAKRQGDGKNWQWTAAKSARKAPVFSGTKSLRRSGKGLIQDYFTGAAAPLRVQAGDQLFAHVWLDPNDPPKSIQLQFHDGTWSHRVRWGAPAHGPNSKGGADFVAGPLPATGEWVRLEVSIDKVGLAPGRQIDGWAFTQVDGTVYWDKAGVRTWGPPSNAHLESLAAWELLAGNDKSVPGAIKKVIRVPAKKRNARQKRLVLDHYLRHVYVGTRDLIAPMLKKITGLDKKSAAIEKTVPTTLVMKERAEPRQAYFLNRGQYDQRGEKVERALPTALPKMTPGLPMNRLGLARWLTHPSHPLTARVTVNRFWQQFFGVGLVKSSEDFGNQGERPSHPKLLDLLATDFVADAWNVKAIVKRIVMSNTYRQSSRLTKDLAARDPHNRLLARGPRFRLDAETLRDQALALSGLLAPKIGGPGVKPPQPDGLWHAVGYSRSNTARFVVDKGHEKQHRRSIYTFWKRTSPPPQMEIFDAPSRELCRVRRERTNTPLQALLLLNDPQFIEAARHLAQRALTEGGANDQSRLAWMFRLATGRDPGRNDMGDMAALLANQRASFGKAPAAARSLIAIGEAKPDAKIPATNLAAWTMVANLILNLDEVLTKN